MAFPFASLFTAIGGVVSAIFGFKGHQADVIARAISVIETANSSTAREVQAIAAILEAEARSEHWLVANWRPILMIIFGGILVSFWFGYTPPNLDGPMSPMMEEIFGLLKLGIGGYLGGRTIEKVLRMFNLSKIIRTFVEKKLV